jgi:hypothetical protein
MKPFSIAFALMMIVLLKGGKFSVVKFLTRAHNMSNISYLAFASREFCGYFGALSSTI